MAHTPSAEPLDQSDPHHELPHHGHVILRTSTLVAVLSALLVLTVLTVASSRAEVWIASTFHVEIPHLVNVLIALSIAVVKCILVAMFFMQLKYDNPLNTIVFLFCLFAFALFLFFSMTDLGARGTIYKFKDGEIKRGGLGISTERTIKDPSGGEIKKGINTGQDGIVAWAKQRRIALIGDLNARGELQPPLEIGELPEARYEKEFARFHSHGAHGHEGPELSSASRSIPPSPGPTPNLYSPKPAAADHGHGH